MEKERVRAVEMDLQAARSRIAVMWGNVREEIERVEWSCKIDIL